MRALEDLTGKRFGRLLVIGCAGKNQSNQTKWSCLCDCGNTITALGYNLKNGNTKSCGCLQKDIMKTQLLKHGKTGSRLFNTWLHMKQRCNNPNDRAYKNYGARGITVCDEWQNDFEAFYTWATTSGYSDNLTIDRIDNNGSYSPENCRWITIQEQQGNKRDNVRVTFNGQIKTVSEWAREFNCRTSAVYREILKREGRLHHEGH